MQLFKRLLCLAVVLVVVNSAPVFDFGADALEGINDDDSEGCMAPDKLKRAPCHH